ncbi:MAG TPA: phosphatase domain-containing protein [Pyrinomonadaceae bacterium]|nr:phosphatase domain-containing protein [Pyrinomonadaceae bacterium]
MLDILKKKISTHLNQVFHDGDVEVTIYPTYGYRQGADWLIPLRGWVHQNRRLPDDMINGLCQSIVGCRDAEMSNFAARFDAFSDDSRSRQEVTIEFDSDNERHTFETSDLNGLIEMTVTLPDARAQTLLERQGAVDNWLSFTVVSNNHSGRGRVRLINPRGVSLVSDIDDTIKVTEVPGDKGIVLKNTFCRDFVPVPGMMERYRALGDVSFHYVSGGPWQLYQPLSEFLAREGFPEGTFHLNYFPKNFLAEDTRSLLIDSIVGSLGRTYDHKVEQISRLMRRFPDREFILVGDSGELDVEVYLRMRALFDKQAREIWIRDVVNDEAVNDFRLKRVSTIIKPERIVCPIAEHYEKLSVIIQREHQLPYNRNEVPPCGGV